MSLEGTDDDDDDIFFPTLSLHDSNPLLIMIPISPQAPMNTIVEMSSVWDNTISSLNSLFILSGVNIFAPRGIISPCQPVPSICLSVYLSTVVVSSRDAQNNRGCGGRLLTRACCPVGHEYRHRHRHTIPADRQTGRQACGRL